MRLHTPTRTVPRITAIDDIAPIDVEAPLPTTV
jgi:hypothetical protein